MKVNRQLNLVLPLDIDSGTLWVHSAPISVEVYERYYTSICRTLTDLADVNLSHLGMRIAYLRLRDAAKAVGEWEGPDGVEQGLLPEIRRLTKIIRPDPGKGWAPLPFDIAVTQGLVSPEDEREVMNAVVFFICNSALVPARNAEAILTSTFSRNAGPLITSLNAMEYAASLRTSTAAENTGETPAPTVTQEFAPPS